MSVQAARARIKTWKESPAQFVHDNFKVEPDRWQKNALDVFPSQDKDKIRIALQACVGPGKSTLLSWCGWNFLSCYAEKGEHPKGAAVSITGENLSDNLWPEFNKWQNRSEFLKKAFTWTKSRIFAVDHPETWFLSARSWAKQANAEEIGRSLSGLHSKFVLVLIDESGNIPLAILKACEQVLSNCFWGKVMQAGNPTSHDGILYAAATTLSHLWHIIRITGDPDDPDRSPRIDIEWAREQIQTFGRDNPWVMSSILGMFPPSSINTLLGPDEVETAMNRRVKDEDYVHAQKRLGVDVARFGDDLTCLFPRQGLVAFQPVIMRNARTNDIAARIVQAKSKWQSEVEFIDDTGGYGAGVIDSLIQSGQTPQAINFAGKAIDPRYHNKRAEIWLLMADWIKRGGSIPPIPELKRDLTAPTYTFRNGKFILEEKALIKARAGYSTDYGDALALTFSLPEMPAQPQFPGIDFQQKVKHDYDPFLDRE